MTTRNNIHRRTFLRGAGGVALSLPLLECMAAEKKPDRAADIPKRFLGVYIGHGVSIADDWNFYPEVIDGKMKFTQSMLSLKQKKCKVIFCLKIRGLKGWS